MCAMSGLKFEETSMIVVLLLLRLHKFNSIQVNTPPTLTLQPSSQIIAIPKMMLEIGCKADANPPPVYEWFKDGKVLNPGSADDERIIVHGSNGRLLITEPALVDEGYYQCKASNELGTAVSQISKLRLAALGAFREMNPRQKSVELGGIAILDCDAPDSVPDASIYWTLSTSQDGSGVESMVGHTSSVTRDHNGRLYIIGVNRNHVDNRFYICNAYNHELGLVRKSVTNELKIVGSTSLQKHPYLLWSSEKNLEYRSGQTARFMFNNEGQELVILNAQPSDSGVYECHGFNDYGIRSHSMNIRVNEMLRWRAKPTNMNAVPNTTVSFVCEPHLPWALTTQITAVYTVQWFKNGKPLKIDPTVDERWSIGHNTLTIRRTNQNDTSVIQCNVTSKTRGFLHANAYLNVISQAPKVGSEYDEYEHVEGSHVVIKCDYFAVPAPRLDWKFRRKRIRNDERHKLDALKGTLEIDKVKLSDAGIYSCLLSNELGSVSANRSLIVRLKTKIKIRPMNQDVKRGSLVVFRCTADHDLKLGVVYEWYKDNRLISSNRRMIIDENDQNSLKILSARHTDTGFYSCGVRTKLDNATEGATLLVQDVPEAPQILSVVCGNDRRANIQWRSPADNYAPVLFYKVQYKTSFEPNDWTEFRITQIRESTEEIFVHGSHRTIIPSQEEYETSHIPSSQTDLKVNLTCWANITFRVIAYNRHGASEPSSPSETMCTTAPCAPKRHPENVKSTGHITAGLRITWTPLKKSDWNAPAFWYEIQWRRKGDILALVQLDHDTHYFDINGSTPYESYEFSVAARNGYYDRDNGTAEEPKVYIGFSGEGRPRYILPSFRVVAILNGNTAQFSWNYITKSAEIARLYGRLKGFVIYHYRDQCGTRCTLNEIILGNVSSAIVDTLTPWSDITARIAVMNDRFIGEPSYPIKFKMPEGKPGVVLNLKVVPFGINGLKAMWKPPNDPHGNILGYFIRIRCVEGMHSMSDIHPHEDISDANIRSYIAGGLIPKSLYRFEIRAFTSKGRSEVPAVGILTIGESNAPSKPRPRVKDITETTANVTWNPFTMPVPGAMYFVKYRRKETGDLGIYEYTLGETMRNFILLYNLDVETDYEIILVASDGIQNGTVSDPVVIRTAGTKFTSTEISRSSWFIGVVVTISILLLLLVVVCMLIRERGINYSIRDFELEEDQEEESGFIEYIKTSAGSMLKAHSLGSRIVHFRHVEETDEDSFVMDQRDNNQEAFGDNCSFVGQYGFPVVTFAPVT